MQYLTKLHLIYDAKYVYISSLFLECVGNNYYDTLKSRTDTQAASPICFSSPCDLGCCSSSKQQTLEGNDVHPSPSLSFSVSASQPADEGSTSDSERFTFEDHSSETEGNNEADNDI